MAAASLSVISNAVVLCTLLSLMQNVRVSAFSVLPTTPFSSSAQSRSVGKTSLGMATWSDPKAVKDYQDFLLTGKSEPDRKQDGPSVIISDGNSYSELAEALWTMGMGDDVVISPFADLPSEMGGSTEYPIYVTLPPYYLAEFIRAMPDSYKERSHDMVFFSGGLNCGNIEDVLKEFAMCRDAQTQVLVSGLKFTDAKRVQDISVQLGFSANEEAKWAGQCTACGKWNGAIAQRMESNAINCKVDFYRDWRRSMWEDSISTAVFHLLGVVRDDPVSYGTVAKYYYDEASEIFWEISAELRGWKAITLTFGFEERMYGFAEAIGENQPCTLDNYMFPYIWGNGAFLQSSTYLQYLHYAQSEKGLLQGIELPPIQEKLSTIMRKGNLRADGVI